MKTLKLLLLVLAVSLLGQNASAQTGWNYDKFGTRQFRGFTIPSTVATSWATVYSDTNGIIRDGTVVMADTTTTSPTRLVVKGWTNTALGRYRIVGLAYGDIPASGTGQPGKVMITGFHGNAKMGASGLSVNTTIKTDLSASGSLNTVVDSLSCIVGYFIGYNSASTVANSRGKVWITRPMGFNCSTLN